MINATAGAAPQRQTDKRAHQDRADHPEGTGQERQHGHRPHRPGCADFSPISQI